MKSNVTKCMRICGRKEKSSKFAKDCTKTGGYFKCCVSEWSISIYETSRNKLIKDGLIKDKPTNICKPDDQEDPCSICSLDGVCTKRDQFTGQISQVFDKKVKQSQKVGGADLFNVKNKK